MGLFSKIFKKAQEEALLEPLDIGSLIKNDMHSHIIHGIDDGSDSLENSLEIINAFVEPSLQSAKVGERFQFQRLGYFNVDNDSTSENLVFNKTVGLRDSWAKK